MSTSSAPLAAGVGTNLRALQRRLAALLPDAGDYATMGGVPTLEVASPPTDLPRLISAVVIEGRSLRASPVHADPLGRPDRPDRRARALADGEGFAGFLDGTQESRILAYLDGLPVILGRVGAVIRLRRNRRLATWRHEVTARIYAPLGVLPPAARAALADLGAEVVDTCGDPSAGAASAGQHPFAVRDAAIHKVQEDRERAEHRLAERWCSAVGEPLFIDGGISANDRVATSACAVGVVKSHRTLYAEGAGLGVILGLQEGERSSVVRITSARRTTVASWYLRLRNPAGRNPMWGLVRVESAYPAVAAEAAIGARADAISRWILRETAPVALPDARWDTMVYGIRDCEQFLRAVM